MPNDDSQRRTFDFFKSHLRSQEPFTKEELRTAAGWSESSLNTYWPKQFKPFVVSAGADTFRVSEGFRPFTRWKEFQRHVTQVRRVSADYRESSYAQVVTYEFFMPLSNEAQLRITLDALFYRDTVEAKLRAEGLDALRDCLDLPEASDEDCMEAALEFIQDNFGGYSIYHVEGRFRSEGLMSQQEAAVLQADGPRYLIDETTAVTRFIFPCEDESQAEKVRFLFKLLFVKSIIQLVNAQDEIWMVESGSRNVVHIWRV